MWRSAQARMIGPSLSRKKRLSAVKVAKIASEANASIPVPTPLISVWNAELTPALASSPAPCALPELTPASWSQPCAFCTAPCRLPSSFCAWSVIPSRTSRAMPAAAQQERDEHQRGGRGARHVPRELPDDRGEHRRDDRRRDDGDDDRVDEREQPHRAAEQHEDADDQPREDAEVAHPAGRAEDAGELCGLQVRCRVGAVGRRGGGVAVLPDAHQLTGRSSPACARRPPARARAPACRAGGPGPGRRPSRAADARRRRA